MRRVTQYPAHATRHATRESGQAAVELALIIMLLIIFLSGIMIVGPLVYIHLAVQTAANDCATAAAQTLDANQGRFQGTVAAADSLLGHRLRTNAGRISLSGVWTRGSPVSCTVSYDVDLSGVPLVERFSPITQIRYTVTLPAQRFKSTWR